MENSAVAEGGDAELEVRYAALDILRAGGVGAPDAEFVSEDAILPAGERGSGERQQDQKCERARIQGVAPVAGLRGHVGRVRIHVVRDFAMGNAEEDEDRGKEKADPSLRARTNRAKARRAGLARDDSPVFSADGVGRT